MTTIDSLVTNKWEFYDVAKMRRLKMMIVIPLVILLWFLFFFLVNMFSSLAGYGDLVVKLVVTTIILLIVIAFVTMKINQMDRDKKDWYFAAFKDPKVNRELMTDHIKDFLGRHKYLFTEESTHRTMSLWITYFTIPSADFKVRLWYSTLDNVGVAEVGFGPETMLNKSTLAQLRTELSSELAAKFGVAGNTAAAPKLAQ